MLIKSLRLTLFCFIGLFLVSCSKPEYVDSKGVGGNFSDYHGRWMIINYWAIWCKPCIEEVPELNHFAKSNEDKVVVLGVDYDQSADLVLQQSIDQLNIQFTVLSTDPAATLGYARPQVLPTTLIFNPSGELVKTLLGPQTEESLLAAISN